MGTIRQEATDYVSKKTLNVSDLPRVSVDMELMDIEKTDDQGKPFIMKVFTMDGEEYRVPSSVLDQLKVFIQENPKLQYFKVIKKGTGFGTKYTVIPL